MHILPLVKFQTQAKIFETHATKSITVTFWLTHAMYTAHLI